MTDDLTRVLSAANAGMAAQSARMRIVSQNVANAQVTGQTPGADPYRRKTISFGAEIDAASDATVVKASEPSTDNRAFRKEYEPGHPAADAQGYVKYPNVDVLVELADMREANRTYLANLQVVKQAREAINATLDLLRSA